MQSIALRFRILHRVSRRLSKTPSSVTKKKTAVSEACGSFRRDDRRILLSHERFGIVIKVSIFNASVHNFSSRSPDHIKNPCEKSTVIMREEEIVTEKNLGGPKEGQDVRIPIPVQVAGLIRPLLHCAKEICSTDAGIYAPLRIFK